MTVVNKSSNAGKRADWQIKAKEKLLQAFFKKLSQADTLC